MLYFWVKAKNSSTTSSFSSYAYCFVPYTLSRPSAPTGLKATATSSSSISLSWNSVSGAYEYHIYYSKSSSSSTAEIIAYTSWTSKTITGLEANTKYYFWVKTLTSDYDSSDFSYSQKYDELSFTVSSLRLDVFVSALCNLSREKASKLITTENVTVNYILQTSNSKTLNVGDVVTIKKYGKFVFTNNNGFSKKGRIRVLVKHFR